MFRVFHIEKTATEPKCVAINHVTAFSLLIGQICVRVGATKIIIGRRCCTLAQWITRRVYVHLTASC